MSDIETLDKLLTECGEMLVECCSILRDEPLHPEKRNIYKLGKAIFEINEVREQIFELRPELKPEKWGKPPTEEDYEDMFQTAKVMAAEHIDAGNRQRAIETWESLIFVGIPSQYENLAKDEIKNILGK